MSVIRFNPYSNGSKGLKNLKKELKDRGHNVKELLKVGSSYRHNPRHTVINWGIPGNNNSAYLNYNASIAANKLHTLAAIASINSLEYTTLKNPALRWLGEGSIVYARTKLCASQGRGIVIVPPDADELVDAPLYTRGIPGDLVEFRVHVFKGQVIDVVQKKRLSRERRGEVEPNDLIRNHENGYIFAREGIVVPDGVKDVALRSIPLLSLDFGAVDVVWNGHSAYVLECNSAPGLEGTTVLKYADAIEHHLLA